MPWGSGKTACRSALPVLAIPEGNDAIIVPNEHYWADLLREGYGT
jgi:hypothetical protein